MRWAVAVLACSCPVASFLGSRPDSFRYRAREVVPHAMQIGGGASSLSGGDDAAVARRNGEVVVRFINTPSGEEVTTTAKMGEVRVCGVSGGEESRVCPSGAAR